jgi:hypothetical protein
MPKIAPKIISVSTVKNPDGTVELRLDPDSKPLALNDYVQRDFSALGDLRVPAKATIDAAISPFGDNPGKLVDRTWVAGQTPDLYPCPALMVIWQNETPDGGKTPVPFTYGIATCINNTTPLAAVGKLNVPSTKRPARRKPRKKAPGAR